jgi:quercetin dioxygenase-like cupin family protein
MRRLTMGAACVVATATLAAHAAAPRQPARADAAAVVVLDDVRVRVFKTTALSTSGVAHGPGVAIPLTDNATRKQGDAYWVDDKGTGGASATDFGPIVFVEPKPAAAASRPVQSASRPGDGTFVGMSFKTIFENGAVTAIRARMDVGAREGLHTHGSDTIVVHLSGGEIEDTADGKTTVNRWRPGDVELESRGSSHSARNIGQAIEVVLVALKDKP